MRMKYNLGSYEGLNADFAFFIIIYLYLCSHFTLYE